MITTRRAIYGKLAGDTTLNSQLATPEAGRAHNIFFDEAPPGTPFPFVLFARQSPEIPVYTLKGRAYGNELWLVKGVDEQDTEMGTADRVEEIAERIKVLLTDPSGFSIGAGGRLMWLRPTQDVSYSEFDADLRIIHAGATFRLSYE